MQLPQSTVSRHLKALADSGWISARAEGTSNVYAMTSRDDLECDSARRLWALVRDQVGPTPAAVHDQRRVQTVLAERRTKSQEFFSSAAGQWDRMRDDLFGERAHLAALAAFADADWTVGDLGCGTGQMTASLAPFVGRVIAVDASAAMLQAAKKRLQGFENVELRRGDLEALPIDDGRLDAATLVLVLHHLPEPDRALSDVARVLKPHGRLLDHRHAAARSRELPPADGPRLARLFRGTPPANPRRNRIRRRSHRSALSGSEIKRSWIVRGNSKERRTTRSRTEQIVDTTKAEPSKRRTKAQARGVGPART